MSTLFAANGGRGAEIRRFPHASALSYWPNPVVRNLVGSSGTQHNLELLRPPWPQPSLAAFRARFVLLRYVPKMKTIGRKVFANSARTFPNKRSAAIVDDAIKLHGARISVTVHNAYRSLLFPGSKSDVCIAADRIVRLKEAQL